MRRRSCSGRPWAAFYSHPAGLSAFPPDYDDPSRYTKSGNVKPYFERGWCYGEASWAAGTRTPTLWGGRDTVLPRPRGPAATRDGHPAAGGKAARSRARATENGFPATQGGGATYVVQCIVCGAVYVV
jgi:hypothetical protein